MISLTRQRYSPIGLDIGAKHMRLVQLSGDREKVLSAASIDLPAAIDLENWDDEQLERFSSILQKAKKEGGFKGQKTTICLTARDLYLQNVRVNTASSQSLEQELQREIAGRLPFNIADAEIRHLEAAEVRQGDRFLKELIVMACQRKTIDRALQLIEKANLKATAIDVEPSAVLRSGQSLCQRDQDKTERFVYFHIGYTRSLVVIAEGEKILIVKYIPVGGKSFDETLARKMDIPIEQANSMRRHQLDRRREQHDSEIKDTVNGILRKETDRLIEELSKCIRYHSVTFRGCPLVRMILGGGEANTDLMAILEKKLHLDCVLADPFKFISTTNPISSHTSWDVAVGLAMKEVEPS